MRVTRVWKGHRHLKLRTDFGQSWVRELGSIDLFVVTSLQMNQLSPNFEHKLPIIYGILSGNFFALPVLLLRGLWKALKGIFWTTFALNLHVAVWSICWIVGLCNNYVTLCYPLILSVLYRIITDFVHFAWGFNSSYCHPNKVLQMNICYILYIRRNVSCIKLIIYEQNASKIIFKNYLSRWQSCVEN